MSNARQAKGFDCITGDPGSEASFGHLCKLGSSLVAAMRSDDVKKSGA
jgi:hypothetical protein